MNFFKNLLATPEYTDKGSYRVRNSDGAKFLNLVDIGHPNLYKIKGIEAYIGTGEVNAQGFIADDNLRALVFDYLEGKTVTLYRGLGVWHPRWFEQSKGQLNPLGTGDMPNWDTKLSKYIPATPDLKIARSAGVSRTGMGPGDDIRFVVGYTKSARFPVGIVVRVRVNKQTPLCFWNYGEIGIKGPLRGDVTERFYTDTTERQAYGINSDLPLSNTLGPVPTLDEEWAYRQKHGRLRHEDDVTAARRYKELYQIMQERRRQRERQEEQQREYNRYLRLQREEEHRRVAEQEKQRWYDEQRRVMVGMGVSEGTSVKPLHDYSSEYIS